MCGEPKDEKKPRAGPDLRRAALVPSYRESSSKVTRVAPTEPSAWDMPVTSTLTPFTDFVMNNFHDAV